MGEFKAKGPSTPSSKEALIKLTAAIVLNILDGRL
jgi:hypothetical protein